MENWEGEGLLIGLAGPQKNTWTWTRSTLGPSECLGHGSHQLLRSSAGLGSALWTFDLNVVFFSRVEGCPHRLCLLVILLPQSCGPRSKGLPADELPQGGSPAMYIFPSTFLDLQCGGLNPSVLLGRAPQSLLCSHSCQ